jgi:hypothetical protein
MNVLCTIWANSKQFAKEQIAILSHAKAHLYKNLKFSIDYLVIEGFDFFSDEKKDLLNLGCSLHDVSQKFLDISSRFPNLKTSFNQIPRGDFYYKNLLRWLVASNFASGSSFIHIDSDLIINSTADELLKDFHSNNFYANSTCFIPIYNSLEFDDCYNDFLTIFEKSPEKFVQEIGLWSKERLISDWELNNILNFKDITEEKFFCYFVKKNSHQWTIPTDSSSLVYIPFLGNMTVPHCGVGMLNEPVKYEFLNKSHFFNGKKLGYMHYQSEFRDILGIFLAQEIINIPKNLRFCPCRPLIPVDWVGDQIDFAKKIAVSHVLWHIQHTNKHELIINDKMIFSYNEIFKFENKGLQEVFSSNFWHTPNVFK